MTASAIVRRGWRLLAAPAMPLPALKYDHLKRVTEEHGPNRQRVDLLWMEVTDPSTLVASDFDGDLATGYVSGNGYNQGELPVFSRKPYTDVELQQFKTEREHGVERRADNSTPCYWQPEYSAEALRGKKFPMKFPEIPKYDARAADVLPGDRKYMVWERQIMYGSRSAHHKNPWYDARGVRQYKVHKFPAGDFLEICGHLVRVNYTMPHYIPNRESLGVTGRQPKIFQYFPDHSHFARYRDGFLFTTYRALIRDLKALGVVATFIKVYRLKHHWWGVDEKILVGVDTMGVKYWESPFGAGLFMRTRFCEFPWSINYAQADDIHPAWRQWLSYTVSNPPNEPENWPIFSGEFYHSEQRWYHQLGTISGIHSMKAPGHSRFRSGAQQPDGASRLKFDEQDPTHRNFPKGPVAWHGSAFRWSG